MCVIIVISGIVLIVPDFMHVMTCVTVSWLFVPVLQSVGFVIWLFSPFGLLNIYRLETLLYLYMLRIKMVCFMTCVGNVSLRKSWFKKHLYLSPILFSVSHLKLCIYKEAGNYRPINIYKSLRCSWVILFLTTVTSWRLSLGMQSPAQPMSPCKAVPQSSPASLYSAHMFYLCPAT